MAEDRVSLCMVIHSHQPVGNFDHVIEEAYQKSYLPFLCVLARHPRIRLSLHYSGILWEWIETRHPEFIQQVRELTERGQVEHIGGGYFEPILAAIPDLWKASQLRRQSAYLKKHFGRMPRGAWVAERVWEQGLITPLVESGTEYIVLDDTHFLAAGQEAEDLHQAYLTEESGVALTLAPSLQSLRYTIPFRDPEETLAILQSGRGQPHRLFAVGDDCEKFGIWPGTYEHCYTNGWLDRFFQALERAEEWLDVTTISNHLGAHPPERRIYLPTASYAEMMMWALPAPATEILEDCVGETNRMPDGANFRRFLRGGPWRNFLSKYPESNQVQKLMLRTAARWRKQRRVAVTDSPDDGLLKLAEDHLLAAQCNDSYWHGIFGGLYAPHLRSAIQGHLIQAESALDRLEKTGASIEIEDFDIDGHQEILIDHPAAGVVIRPADGATISSLRSKASALELINSLQRRPEAYHRQVREKKADGGGAPGAPASIHDNVASKETNLASLLCYDRYARHSYRTYLFPRQKTFQDFISLQLEENEELARGAWSLVGTSLEPLSVGFTRSIGAANGARAANLTASKEFTLSAAPDGGRAAWELVCILSFSKDDAPRSEHSLGIEIILNLLAPNSPDRYFVAGGERRPLEFRGEIAGPELRAIDEWRRLEIGIEAPGARAWWIVPIETISQSEAGFERVYQGSAILAVWDVVLGSGQGTSCSLKMRVRVL